jgi:hypothetical protein
MTLWQRQSVEKVKRISVLQRLRGTKESTEKMQEIFRALELFCMIL